jgi:D-proline reductase (dithiol) PrdB
VFPAQSLTQLEQTGEIGNLADKAYTFMGGIYSARKVKEIIAPEITARLLADQADLALLVPV